MGAAASRPRARANKGSKTKGKEAGAPATQPASPAPGDVASGADIVLGSHVQAPPEEAPHRAGAYDEILAWLDWEFHKHDINKDGSLDYHEFMRFVRGLDLKLSTRETFQFFAIADRDNDERIVWSEIEQDVPMILSKIYQTLPPSPADWCEMVLPPDADNSSNTSGGSSGGGGVAYFNKRTSEVRRDRPAEMDGGPVSSLGPGATSATAAAANKEVVLENTETLDALLTWLDWEFKKADYDKNGTLSREEVAGFIQGLRLGLGPKEVERFCRLADFNGDGVVEWKEVLELTPLILQKLYSAIEPGPHDFVRIVDARQQVHYLNKRTGAATTEPPPGFMVAEATVSVVACGKGEEETTTGITESPSVRGTGAAAASASSSAEAGGSSEAAE